MGKGREREAAGREEPDARRTANPEEGGERKAASQAEPDAQRTANPGKARERERKSLKRWLLDLLAGSRMRFDLLRFNLGPLMVVVVVYTLLASVVVVPVLSRAMQAIMDASGLESLTADNALTFLLNPLTILGVLALLVCLAFYALLELGSSIYTFDAARQRKHVSVRAIFAFSLRNAVRMFRPKNLPIILVCLVMVPFVGLAMSSSVFSAFTVPTALIAYVRSSSILIVAFTVAVIACFVLSLRWMYVLHFYTIEGLDFPDAIRRSGRLKRSQRIQNLLSMLIIQGILAAVNKVVSVVGLTAVALILDTVGAKSMVGAVLASTVLVAFLLLGGFLTLVGVPVGALKISGKFYQLTDASGEKIQGVDCKEAVVSRRAKVIDRVVAAVIIVVVIAGFAVYANQVATGQHENSMVDRARPEVIALEGGGSAQPQNSLASLDAQAKGGADGTVVNVQMSKDGVLFLATSPDLAVACGIRGESEELDYEEIHAESVKLKGSEDRAAPKLSDAIRRASEDGISLMLDVSSLSSREGALEAVVAEVKSAGALSWCEIASSAYGDLARAKSLEPEARTVLVAGVSGSDYGMLADADAVALEGALVSKDNVAALHASGHKAYAWSVSSTSKLDTAIKAKVDALVTSNVSSAIEEADHYGLNAIEYAFFSRLQ